MSYLDGDASQYDEEDWSLWTVLGESVDHWHDVYKHYWAISRTEAKASELDPETQVELARLDEAAPKMLQHAFALRLVGSGGSVFRPLPELVEPIRRILKAYGDSPVVRDRWSFAVAHDVLDRLDDSSARVAELLNLVQMYQLNERTAAYLARVTRLYVYGFDVEALVMCRAALEAALQDALPDEQLAEAGFKKSGREYTLATRISAAGRAGYFNRRRKELAHSLREAGNHALHTAPGFLHDRVGDALEAISGLAELLAALSDTDRPDR